MVAFIKKNIVLFIILLIVFFFFNKFFIFGLIPFPGDLLVGNYEPYKSKIVGVPHKGQGADVVRELYPWKYFSIEQFKKGEFPLWNPHVFSGNTHFANLQSGALYPVNILFFLLPFIPAWSLYIISQYLFMLLFMYLYLRQIKLSKIASLFGSVSFSFSAFMVVWGWYGNLGHTLSFLPLILFALEKFTDTQRARYLVLFIVSFVLSTFAGYIQFTLYMYMLVSGYLLIRFFAMGRKNIRQYAVLVIGIIISICISAVQVIPLFESVKESLRSTYSYDVLLERLMPPESAITLLIPDFFGNPATLNYFLRGGSSLERAASIGIWPILFVILALFSKNTFYKLFFGVSGLLIFISTLSIPPIAYFHSIGIPFLSTGIPTRALSLFCFCLSVLAAIGVESYLKNQYTRSVVLKIIGIVIAIFIALFAFTVISQNPQYEISRRNMVIPFGLLVVGGVLIFTKIPKKISLSIILLITVFELFYSFQKFNAFVKSDYVYPNTVIHEKIKQIQGSDRYWGYGSASIDSSFQIVDGTYTTSGYDALYPRRYGEFLSASKDGKIPPEVPRSVADVYPGYGSSELKDNPFRQRALDLTGTKYVLNKKNDLGIDSAFDENIYALIWQENGWQIYENKQVLPHIKLFGRYQILEDSEIIEKLYTLKFDYGNIIVLEEKLPEGFSIGYDPDATVTDIVYSPNKISFTTRAEKDQIVFLSDNYFPGWKAYVDGEEVDILRANYTFRAVPVKKGVHTVQFVYEPQSFSSGVLISVVGLICLLIVLFFASIKRKEHDDKTIKK